MTAAKLKSGNLGIRTLGNRVIVLKDEVEELTEGGVLMTQDTQKEEQNKVNTGVVVKVGPGFRRSDDPTIHIPMNCQLGDRIQFSQFASSMFPITYKDVEYYVIREDDILVIEDSEG